MIEYPATPFNEEIEYKELNQSDFIGYNLEDGGKVVIEPDENGYISDELGKAIDLGRSDTTIINAGVGQGKTKAIIDYIKWYNDKTILEEENYKVVVITPFKSLNEAYKSKIQERLGNEESTFDYQDLIQTDDEIDYNECFAKNIQLISIMSIMGDPGTLSYRQSRVKREYYNYFINKCEVESINVIFIFDEIHESLRSFKPEYIPNLFKWKSVVHKAIVASATFTESSKAPLRYIAELTNKRVKIIESIRQQKCDDDLSELHLCLYNEFLYKTEDEYIKSLIQKEVNVASRINILCCYKSIAKNLYHSSVGEMLRDEYGLVNLCIGDKSDNFEHDACNIGTKFKTGISIEHENSAFFIFLPLKFAYTKSDNFGIFTDRVNSLVQALARPRKKSRIYVIMPPPEKLILRGDDGEDYKKRLSRFIVDTDAEYEVPYYELARQQSLLFQHYNSVKQEIENEIETVSNLNGPIRVHYNTFDWFRLTKGDAYLSTQYYSYGKNLSDYLYWAAWNNQFVNCKLKSIRRVKTYYFHQYAIQGELDGYFPISVFNQNTFVDHYDKHLYLQLRNTLFAANLFYKKEGEKNFTSIEPFRNSMFEQQIMHFIQRRKTPYFFEPEYGCPYSTKKGDYPYVRKLNKINYLRHCIAESLEIMSGEKERLSGEEDTLIKAYMSLFSYKNIIEQDYSIENDKGDLLLPRNKDLKLTDIHSFHLKAIFKSILKLDLGIKAFNTDNFQDDKGIYSMIRDIFYEVKDTTRSIDGTIIKCLRVIEEKRISSSIYRVNLLHNVYDPFLYMPTNPENFIEDDSDELFDIISIVELSQEENENLDVYDYYNENPNLSKRDKLF